LIKKENASYIQRKFQNVSDAKLKEGIFDGPQIRTLMKDEIFVTKMNNIERSTWQSFKNVVENFLGNHKSENYEELVAELTETYRQLGCLMNLKLHFLKSHLQHFPDNLGDYNEEQGKRFHQDIKEMERRYQGRWNEHMMADFCWMLKKEHVMKGKKRKRNRYIDRSKIKRFAKARDLKKKPKHTLPEKILHLQSYILIESPIEIPQFEIPESRGYTAEGLLLKT